MPRVALPEVHHPRLQFRYMFMTSKLPGASIYARSAAQPSVSNQHVQVDFRSGYMTMKGRTQWEPITLSCYSFEGITENELYSYFNKRHFDIDRAVEREMFEYKHTILLMMLNPMNIPTAVWKLEGAFIDSVSWGELDYGGNDVIQCDVTIVYDYALFNLDLI